MSDDKKPVVADEASEKLTPWANRWTNNHIGFHLNDVNPVIKKYGPRYLTTSSDEGSTTSTAVKDDEVCDAPDHDKNKRIKRAKRVFVPLCGKTVDLAYLTDLADEVVGVEGIRMALEQFAEEQAQLNVSLETTTKDGFEKFQGDKITLLKGDYFELDATKTDGVFDFIFDRASMVAIDPKLRESYVEVLGSLLAPGGTILLVVLERQGSDEAMKQGPPFTIPEVTVRELYEPKEWVESITFLEKTDQLEEKPEDKERYPDLDHLYELVFEIKRKA
ncbi:thiopurine S-methyltransferase [Nitzschia inconspicua]|uniref:thiopurine S-methyltransferase n=1 Tax=Nitzschia inconspicua TaxID=303405 RepID=A0A9K3PN63_9STRA|nr:thiopurine S-methyltransferase [Nitzschia inconspicua]